MFKKDLVALKKMILTMPQCPLKTMGNLYTITNSAPRYLLSAWVISAWLAWNFTVWSSKRHKTIHSLKQALNRSIVGDDVREQWRRTTHDGINLNEEQCTKHWGLSEPEDPMQLSRYGRKIWKLMRWRVKAKVYFTLYANARDSVQCAWCEFRHQNSTRVLYGTPRFL